MFNDTMKVSTAMCAKSLGKGEDFVVNNFDIELRFKHLRQDVELRVTTSDLYGLGISIIDTRSYKTWETTPVLNLPESVLSVYNADNDVKYTEVNATAERIDDILRANDFTLVSIKYIGRHDSGEYFGAMPLRAASITIDIEPGIFK